MSCNEFAAAALKLKLQPGYRIAGHLSPEPNWESAVAAVAVAIYSGNGDLCTHYSIIMLFCCHFATILLPFCHVDQNLWTYKGKEHSRLPASVESE